MYAGSVLLSKRINISVSKQTTQNVLTLIEKKSGVHFMYNPQMVNLKKVVSLDIKNGSIQHVLQILINNRDVVFYEMGNYVVITHKNQAPVQANIISAFLPKSDSLNANSKMVIDTIHMYDTIVVNKTQYKNIEIFDTVKVFDTVKIVSQTKINKNEPTVSISTNNKYRNNIEFEVSPVYSVITKNKNLKPEVGFAGRILWERNTNKKITCGIGVGAMLQQGFSLIKKTEISVDSIKKTDTVQVYVKYKKGDYYYIIGNDTIYKAIYDSTLVDVSQEWYEKSNHKKETEEKINYTLLWMTLPLKLAYKVANTEIFSFWMNVYIVPALAVKKYGYVSSGNNINKQSIESVDFKEYMLSVSIEPAIKCKLTRTVYFKASPFIQMSLNPVVKSGYLIGQGVLLGLVKSF